MILVTLALLAAGATTVRAIGSAPGLDNAAQRDLVGPRHRHAL